MTDAWRVLHGDSLAMLGDFQTGGEGAPLVLGGKKLMTSMSDLFSSREMRALQGEAPTPLYFQLFSLLKNRILNGSIPHGEQLPTEEELAKLKEKPAESPASIQAGKEEKVRFNPERHIMLADAKKINSKIRSLQHLNLKQILM